MWLTAGAGALVAGVSQGVGTEIAARWLSTAPPDQTRGPSQPAAAGAAAAPAVAPSPAIVTRALHELSRARLSASARGRGASEALACGAAVTEVRERLLHDCDGLLMAQGGTERRIEPVEARCSTCGVAGGQWVCVAQAEPVCRIFGDNDAQAQLP